MPSRGARPRTPRTAISGSGSTAASRFQGDVLLGTGSTRKRPRSDRVHLALRNAKSEEEREKLRQRFRRPFEERLTRRASQLDRLEQAIGESVPDLNSVLSSPDPLDRLRRVVRSRRNDDPAWYQDVRFLAMHAIEADLDDVALREDAKLCALQLSPRTDPTPPRSDDVDDAIDYALHRLIHNRSS